MLMSNGSYASNGGGPPTVHRARRDTAHLTVVFEPGSYAEQHQAAVADAAERALGGVLSVLKIPGEALLRPHRITVAAGDAIETPSGAGGLITAGTISDLTSDVVTTVYTASSPGIGLSDHLARVVIHRLTAAVPSEGPRSDAAGGSDEAQTFFIDGAGRYVAHRAAHRRWSVTPEVEAAEKLCLDYAARQKWRLPLYQAIVGGPQAAEDPALYDAMQEAFSAYLLERDGIREFLRFVAGARTDPNHSAEIIYGKSLELLEAEWIVLLRGDMGRRLVSLWEFLRRVWPYIRPYPWRQAECFALMLIGSISTQVSPYQIRNLVDLLGSNEAKADPWGYGLDRVIWILLAMTVAGLFNLCSVVRLVYVVNVLGQNILRDMRVAYIDRINGLGANYFSRMRTGDVMARFTSDMSRLADPLAKTTAYSMYYIVLLVISFFGLIGLSWQLTLILLVIVPVYISISRLLGPRLQRVTRSRNERLAQVNSHLEELVIAHPMIQIFNLQRFMRRRMEPEIREFRRVEIRGDFLRAVFEEASDIADLLSTRLVWLVGAALVLAQFDPAAQAIVGPMTIGTVVGFNTLMGRFILPVHRLANIYSSVAVAAASLRRIEDVMTQPMEDLGPYLSGTARGPAPTNGTVRHGPTINDRISIENLSFAYGTTPTLIDVSVEIPAGSSAAFVGPTGAGKTTLVNMIPRFYDPASGVVRLDGRDVRDYPLPDLRSQIALVSQENFLFNATLRDNIALGKLGATDEEVVDAAKQARLHDFIMSLPAGYNSMIGERGSRLSGGQRQRLAIARALLRGSPILILDEATSALDAETEHEILEELATVTAGKTVISITHRLALAMRCDVIYVLDKGRIVESGTHEELLAARGLYRKLFEDQNEALLESGLVPGVRMGAGSDGAPTSAPA
jgi:ABC-type multidrug transport system fused ATPase/permease subunit